MLVKTNGLYDHRQFKRKQGEVLAEIIKAMEVYASQFKTQNAGPRL